MQDSGNRGYYQRRAQQERERANIAADDVVARVHRQFADAYERRSEPLESRPVTLCPATYAGGLVFGA